MAPKILPVDYPNVGGSPRDVSQITDFIIHHTAGSPGQTAREIDAEHRAIGDAMIAYNWVIDPMGRIYAGRPANLVPAAAYGRNSQSVNVALTGNYQSDDSGYTGAPPTEAAIAALSELCLWAHLQFPTIVRTIGHRDVATLFFGGDGNYATLCPGNTLYALIARVKGYVSVHMAKR